MLCNRNVLLLFCTWDVLCYVCTEFCITVLFYTRKRIAKQTWTLGTPKHNTTQHNTTQHNTTPHRTTPHNATYVQYAKSSTFNLLIPFYTRKRIAKQTWTLGTPNTNGSINVFVSLKALRNSTCFTSQVVFLQNEIA